MKVLSLFDGISCGYEALKRAGIKIDAYYASEIDKYAIQISKKNPAIIHLGDIKDWKTWGFEPRYFDLIMGGSPCQGFSMAGKQLNFEDKRSKLFFVFNEIIKYFKPKYFLLENVKMKKEYQDVISSHLRVKPISINSALVSAQNRKRLYWANWEITQPPDRGILLKDIVLENTIVDKDKSYCVTATYSKAGNLKDYFVRNKRQLVFETIEEYIVPFDKTLKILDKEVERGKIGYFRKDSQANRVYFIHGKAITLCGSSGGGAAKMGQYLFGCITLDRINKRQNGQRFNEGEKFYTLTAQDQHGIMTEGYIRKLTPVECERLQCLQDGYTEGISKTQRYKCLGNAWTIDVIKHIFEDMKRSDKNE